MNNIHHDFEMMNPGDGDPKLWSPLEVKIGEDGVLLLYKEVFLIRHFDNHQSMFVCTIKFQVK